MAREEGSVSGRSPRRRDVLRALGVGGAMALAGCDGDGDGGTTTASETVTFLLATSESGEYAGVGELERNGFELAIKHLNEGGGLVETAFDDLGGDGVLGRTVESVVEDTENDPENTRTIVDRNLGDGGPTMVTGGVGGDVVYAIDDVATDAGVLYMAGSAPVPALTGERCGPTTFREGCHAGTILDALGPELTAEFGDSRTYYQLSADATEGEVLKNATRSYFSRSDTANWQARGQDTVRPGSTNLDSKLQSIANRRPGVVVLNLFGLDAVNAVRAANEALSEDTGVVVPVIDDSLGYTLGADLAGIVGTVPWDAGLEGDRSATYDEEYVISYGRSAGGQAQAGSGTAHVTYTQTLLYAAAAERAGSFDGEAVATALEGMEYDVGIGPQKMRGCDHQSTRPVPVVKGIENLTADRNRLELLTTPRHALGDCDASPAADCSL